MSMATSALDCRPRRVNELILDLLLAWLLLLAALEQELGIITLMCRKEFDGGW